LLGAQANVEPVAGVKSRRRERDQQHVRCLDPGRQCRTQRLRGQEFPPRDLRPAAGFVAPYYKLENIEISYNWIHSTWQVAVALALPLNRVS